MMSIKFCISKFVLNVIMALQDNVIAIGSEHSCIFLYSTTTGTLITKLEGHTNRYNNIIHGSV